MGHADRAAGSEAFRRTERHLCLSLTGGRGDSDIALAFEHALSGRAAGVNAKRLGRRFVVRAVELGRVARNGCAIINGRTGGPGCEVEQELSLCARRETRYRAIDGAAVSTGEGILGSARLRHRV